MDDEDIKLLLTKLDELKRRYDTKAEETGNRLESIVSEAQSLAVVNCILIIQGILFDSVSAI